MTPRARILSPSPRNLRILARALERGEPVGIPTETVYGLAANAFDEAACRRIFRIKRRPLADPLIVHIGRRTELGEIAQSNPVADLLAATFWPGPLTLVLPKKTTIPDLVTSGLPSVAVRMPRHPALRKLLHACGLPLAAPSANPFGYVSPTTAQHVADSLGHRLRYILDGGPCRLGLESTILDLRRPDRPVLLRPGSITREMLEETLGIAVSTRRAPASKPAVAPGLLKRHYSPRTPVILREHLDTGRAAAAPAGDAFLFFRRPHDSRLARRKNVFWLDSRGDSQAAARRLFSTLRALDAGGFSRIFAESAPDEGAGTAINDRLRRAAGKG